VEQAEKRSREVVHSALAGAIDDRVKLHTEKATLALQQQVTAKLRELDTLARQQRADAQAQVWASSLSSLGVSRSLTICPAGLLGDAPCFACSPTHCCRIALTTAAHCTSHNPLHTRVV
jgi:hypothetical protein